MAAACGSDGEDLTSGASTGGDAPSAEAFPVTLTQQGGSVTIESQPEAVYVLDPWSFDLVTELGVQPIGVALWPGPMSWVTGPLVDATPVTEIVADLPLEEIAAAQPDLLIDAGGYHTWDPGMAELLNDIAPTVAPVGDPELDPWQDTVRHIAAALGRTAEGEELIADAETLIAGTASDYPQFEGTSLSFARWNPDQSTYGLVAGEDDLTRRFLNGELGFTTPQAQLDELAAPGEVEVFGATMVVSAERFDLAAADVVVMNVVGGEPGPLLENPLWLAQPFVAEDRVVYVDDEVLFALISPSPRAFSFALDAFAGEAAEILDR